MSSWTILEPLLFNIFIKNLFYFIRDAQLLNFADGNTIATFSNSADDLITDLQKESDNAIDWFCSNEMAVNSDKFQSIIIKRFGKLKNSYQLLTEDHKIDSKKSVTLLCLEIDNKLNFEEHVTALYQKVMEMSRLRRLVIDIFMTLKFLNPQSVSTYF